MEVALQENLYLPPFENTHEDKNTAFFDETIFWFFKQEADMMIPLVLAASLCHFYTRTTRASSSIDVVHSIMTFQ